MGRSVDWRWGGLGRAALCQGLYGGFQQVREAVAALRRAVDPNVLMFNTRSGLTAKWQVYPEAAADRPIVEAFRLWALAKMAPMRDYAL